MEAEYLTPPALAPGFRLDRYELLCPIAEGGMAQVWIARMRGKHGFERMVAVKTILPKYAEETSFRKMFLDEARIASGIEHTNVAQTLDLGEQHGVLYLVMELVDGEALTKLLAAVSQRTRRMPYGIILRVLADTCGGLHVAHELRGADGSNLGVVHRDVSPQNILVTTRGVAKLIDFGIAKAKDRLSGETSSGLVKGKIKYMAPEQALGRALDRRVDVWAVGAILYRVIAGRPPYNGANDLEVLHALTSGKPPAPMAPTVPEAIANVALRALSYDPAQRFATTAEMQAAMEQAMVAANCTTTTYDVQEFVADHLLDRAAARRQTLELALMAAKERDRMESLLKVPEADSSSGILDVGSRVLTLGRKPPMLPGMRPALPVTAPRAPAPLFGAPPRPADEEGDLTVPFQSPASPSAPPVAPPAAGGGEGAAFGGAALAPMRPGTASHDVLTMLSNPRRRQLAMIVGAGLAGLVVVMLIAIALTHDGSEAHAVATTSFARWAKTLRLPDPPPPDPPPPAPASADTSFALAGAPARAPAPAKPAPIAAPQPAQPVASPAPRPTATATAAPPKKSHPDLDGF